MASSSSLAQGFLDLLRKSNLVPNDRLERWLHEARPGQGLPAAAKELAALLVKDGLLTAYQAQRLLDGKWQHFILNHKYKILSKLGEGGWSSVFLCEHLTMNRRVAIKVLLPKLAGNPGVVQRFLREAAAVGSLNHPNIVHAFDFDCDGAVYFLATEYVEGIDLNQLVRKQGPLAIPRALSCVDQAASGLQYACQAGWVHRDIKPSNLLVDAAGRVKILDLGLARLFHDESDALTQQFDKETTLGTADYMAPEQAMNSHEVDIRADIYSLGATLYFLLAGRAPFADCSTAQKLMMHVNRSPRPIRELRPQVSQELAAVLDRMLAKSPADRYQTPAEVQAALHALPEFPAQLSGIKLGGELLGAAGEQTLVPSSVGSTRPTAPKVEAPKTAVERRREQQHTTRRRWRAFNVAGAGVLLVLVGVVVALAGRTKTPTEEPEPVAAVPAVAPPTAAPLPRPSTRPFRFFDGAPKTIVVVSGTAGGHVQLKSRLVRQPGGERIALQHVAIGAFTGPSLTRQVPAGWCPKSKWDKAGGPVIYIVLGGIGVGTDSSGTRLPAALGRLTPQEAQAAGLTLIRAGIEQALAQGVDLVLLTNSYFQRSLPEARGGAEPYPELVQAHNQSALGQRHPAIDLFTPFQAHCPLAASFDRTKPSEAGRELLAHLWFAALCAWDGVPVPDWSQALVVQAFAEEQQRRQVITHVLPRGGESYQVGDTIPITWKCNPRQCSRVVIHLLRDDAKASRTWTIIPQTKVGDADGGSYQWVIPANLRQKSKDVPLEPGTYRIVVQKLSGQEWGASEAPFTITRK